MRKEPVLVDREDLGKGTRAGGHDWAGMRTGNQKVAAGE